MIVKHSAKWIYYQLCIVVAWCELITLVTIGFTVIFGSGFLEPKNMLWFTLFMNSIFLVGAFLKFMIQNIARAFTEQLVIDDNEVHITKGVVSRYTSDIPYSWIVSVEVSQTIFERVFRIGTLEIQTVKNISGVHFSGIDNPDMIKQSIYKRMADARAKRSLS